MRRERFALEGKKFSQSNPLDRYISIHNTYFPHPFLIQVGAGFSQDDYTCFQRFSFHVLPTYNYVESISFTMKKNLSSYLSSIIKISVNSPKNNLRREAIEMTSSDGAPSISIIHANCSTSFSPGNRGHPVQSSARIQPRDHMSMGGPQGRPSIT